MILPYSMMFISLAALMGRSHGKCDLAAGGSHGKCDLFVAKSHGKCNLAAGAEKCFQTVLGSVRGNTALTPNSTFNSQNVLQQIISICQQFKEALNCVRSLTARCGSQWDEERKSARDYINSVVSQGVLSFCSNEEFAHVNSQQVRCLIEHHERAQVCLITAKERIRGSKLQEPNRHHSANAHCLLLTSLYQCLDNMLRPLCGRRAVHHFMRMLVADFQLPDDQFEKCVRHLRRSSGAHYYTVPSIDPQGSDKHRTSVNQEHKSAAGSLVSNRGNGWLPVECYMYLCLQLLLCLFI